jgi:cyclic beta-1,2-glucan synthetase
MRPLGGFSRWPWIPVPLQQILNSGEGPILEPIRSEMFGPERFAAHGRSLGDTHRAARQGFGQATFYPRLQNNIQCLRQAHGFIADQARSGHEPSAAAEWLLDNFHLIEAQLREIRESLPRQYYRSLPVLQDAPLEGLPRIYGVAWAFVAHTDGAFNEALLVDFLQAYQERRELTLGELWALPTTLRVVLVENLRRLAEHMAAHLAAQNLANLCADRLDQLDMSDIQRLLETLALRGVDQAFLVQLAQNIQGHPSGAPHSTQESLRPWLHARLPDLMAVHLQQNADQAANNLSVGNAVTALRTIGANDWHDTIARISLVMQVMLKAPVFEAEDSASRDVTLHAIEQLALSSAHSESDVATLLLSLMNAHIGAEALSCHWLQREGRQTLENQLGLSAQASRVRQILDRAGAWTLTPAYVLVQIAAALGLSAWLLDRHGVMLQNGNHPGLLMAQALAALALLLPASEAAFTLINRLISESVRPTSLPRFALEHGIPAEERVLVVVPGLLSDETAIQEMVHRLHLHWLANQEAETQFALLSDWSDAPTRQTDADAALLAQALEAIRALNREHPVKAGAARRFVLLHRERVFSTTQQAWMGWDRKRGKLEHLIAALANDTPGPFLDLGEDARLATGTRHVLTLDSDTQLPPGRLRALAGVAAHPQNKPHLSASGTSVVQGYGILQPRVVAPLPLTGQATPYQWLFSGQRGIDSYSAMTSDVYQDAFGEGSFTGKGLLNVAAVHAVLDSRLPPEQVLSHDLLEGALARCATVSDVTLIESDPSSAEVASTRLHRWTRGDWQLLPFLLRPGRWPLAAIHRWKLLDNLRRSLVAPASLVLLLLSALHVGLTPWAALGLVAISQALGPLMGALTGLLPRARHMAWQRSYRMAGTDLLRAVAGGLWHLVQLPRQAADNIDAMVRTLYRLAVSRRQLMSWSTAHSLQTSVKGGLGSALLRRPMASALSGAWLLWMIWSPGPWRMAWTGLAACWLLAPLATWWAGRAHPPCSTPALTASETDLLNHLARDSWRLFERIVNAQSHHLPPDNLQTSPTEVLAQRTSPTNMGLYLLSLSCARQFGWVGTITLLDRMEATLHTMDQLQRHEGHFLNWYDTQSLQPLNPRYVSTVDSGNLSAHLLAVAQACTERAKHPLDPAASQQALARAQRRVLQASTTHHATDTEELAWLLADQQATLESCQQDEWAAANDGQAHASERLLALAHRLQTMAWAADFRFLYHPRRRLLHIGYRLEEQQLDTAYYDLLASEARLTSLLAIARGDLPVHHWAALGRPFFAVGLRAGLRSWSGSMFEYLMPSLVLLEPEGSALHEAGQAALVEQMAYQSASGRPWGISECAYAGRDHTLTYQYAPQGVPRLALRRTPAADWVVAPYATALAAQVNAPAACANLAALQALTGRSRYGLCEALDYTPSRQTQGGAFTRVDTHMAHHQGMTIVALANVLLDGAAQRWGMADPHIECVQSLLQERAPRDVRILNSPPPRLPWRAPAQRSQGLTQSWKAGDLAVEPTHLMGNGRYCVSLRPNGAGWSRWGQTNITRGRDDALRDTQGSFLYLRFDPDSPPVSLTSNPAPDPGATYQCTYFVDRVVFDALWPGLHAQTTVWVSPEDDIEFRRVTLTNLSGMATSVELLSAFELTLATPAADTAHPAFSSLFVQAHWLAQQQTLHFERKSRTAEESTVQAAHFVAEAHGPIQGVRCQTSRMRWQGRNQPASSPRAELHDCPDAPQDLDTGLDPMCALAVQLSLAPHAQSIITFATAASDNGSTLRAMIDKYRQPSCVDRSSLMSATLAGIVSEAGHLRPDFLPAFQALTTAVVLSLARSPALSTGATAAAAGRISRAHLWRLTISGDRPLLLVHIATLPGLGLVRTLVQALREWSRCGVSCDVVVLSSEPASYQMPLMRELSAMAEHFASDQRTHPGAAPCGMHVHRTDDINPQTRVTLECMARVQLVANGLPLHHHVQAWVASLAPAGGFSRPGRLWLRATPTPVPVHWPEHLVAPARGALVPDTGNFVFQAGATFRPPKPWINVLSNPGFGALISEAGGGYTWAVNSRLNQLTPWSNDPVADPPGEWFLLQDRRSQAVWSLFPCAWSDPQLTYTVTHSQGLTTMAHRRGDLGVRGTWCVDAGQAVKHVRIELVNHGNNRLHLRLMAMAEWQMGEKRSDRSTTFTAQTAPPAPHTGTTLLCTQLEESGGFGGGTAFLSMPECDADGPDWTCDRREFFNLLGQLQLPMHLAQQSGAGLDPCAALARRVSLLPGQRMELVFLLGHADNPAAAATLAETAMRTPPSQREDDVRAQWARLLGATRVSTPDPLFDALVNHWLLYQTVSSRLWAKTAFYQAGGATGFRDQLQDAMALAWADPAALRAQIALAASRQFEAGDVQHWWHAPGGAGVRTHFSDDLLWLPYACTHHQRTTGDATLLDEIVPFLEGEDIPPGEEDRYDTPRISADSATVYEHCARAIDHSLRTGSHGLPLMGSGDWNDGMNRVGAEGQGESVWLAWFLCAIVADWVPLARSRGDEARAQHWSEALQGWQAALDGPAWDGAWFVRAFFDNGSPLGSHTQPEARIDLIAQAWAVLSGVAPPQRQQQAMASAHAQLVNEQAGLIQLLTPPLVHAAPSAGYIQAYPPACAKTAASTPTPGCGR